MSQVSFVGLEPSDALRAHAEQKIQSLGREQIMRSCRVVIEAHRHGRSGNHFRAKFEIDVPRETLVVGSRGEELADPYAAIDAGYDEAKRAIREHAARLHDRKA